MEKCLGHTCGKTTLNNTFTQVHAKLVKTLVKYMDCINAKFRILILYYRGQMAEEEST